jgi:hypothetical protein
MKNRQLKSINIAFISDAISASDIQKIPQIKEIIFEELVLSIEEAYKTEKQSIPLFEINNSGYVLELDKEYWVSSLEQAVLFYEGNESYEKCAFIKKLIESVYGRNGQGNKKDSTSHRKYSGSQNSNKKKKENIIITK